MLANVVDDVTMRISHVVRAEEHLPNTPKQQMIWEALGHEPPVWAHVPVLVNEQRKKLSKRRDKVALEMYRDEGYLAPAMVNYLMTLGWSPGEASADGSEIVGWDVIESAFRLEDVNLSPAFFDVKKLGAFNGEYIRAMSRRRTGRSLHAVPRRRVAGAGGTRPCSRRWHRYIQPRLVTLADAPGVVDFLFIDDPEIDQESWDKTMTGDVRRAAAGRSDRGVRRRRRC